MILHTASHNKDSLNWLLPGDSHLNWSISCLAQHVRVISAGQLLQTGKVWYLP
jgi:hypothetical protein